MEDQIYITIAKVLHGEASDAERREVDAWIQSDKTHANIFEEIKASWASADILFDTPHFDAAPAWQKVSARINATRTGELTKRGKVIAFPAWVRYSSAIAAMLIIAVTIWNPFRTEQIRIVAQVANQRIELPDHSIITLRKGSSLSYPETFTESERAVSLNGEAFFEVTRNERQPFVVDAQAVSVKVLGTSFNVQCNESSADVSVTTGKVQVSVRSDAKKTVILTPGNAAHYDKGSLIQGTATGHETFWKAGELSFNNEPFSRVVAALAKATDTVIKLHTDLSVTQREQAITVTFRAQSLEDMLTELCLITNCRWEKVGTSYLIRTK
jgi:ferric-dicitrate binding protein FerR (iron transport regulator)